MIREAFRMKAALVIILFLLLVVPSLPFVLKGDGTLPGKVRLVMTYSMGAVTFLLSLLAIFLSCASLSGDVREKRVETIATKPVARWEIVAGKWVGIVALCATLLAAMGGLGYGLIRYVSRPAWNTSGLEVETLRNEVLTARASAQPEIRDDDLLLIGKAVEEEYERRMKEGVLRPDETEARAKATIREDKIRQFYSLRPGEHAVWLVRGLPPYGGRNDYFFLRYKVDTSEPTPDKTVVLAWALVPGEIGDEGRPLVFTSKESVGDYHEVPVRAGLIPSSGVLTVAVRNPDEGNVSVVFTPGDSFTLMYRTSSFELNYARALLLVLARVAFLAALGVGASALVSFPVAALLVFFVFGTSLSIDFLRTTKQLAEEAPPTPEGGGRMPLITSVVLTVVTRVIPNFSAYDGVGPLSSGFVIPWALVFKAMVVLVGAAGGLCLGAGCYVFSRRELSAVTV